jgi:hypothetical protein
MAIYRTQLFDPADMDNVKKIQAGYKVQTLSAFLGKPALPPAPAVEWPKFEQDAFTTRFGEYLSFVLQFCPPAGTAAVEKPLRENFAKIGIAPGAKAPAHEASPEMKAALGDAVKAAFARINETANSVGTDVNGWRVGAAAGSRAFYNGRWALRAAAAKLGIYGNDADEAVYPFAKNDGNGLPLDGSKHAYAVTFAADALPPVNAFWSITMYDGRTQLLIDNPINRYLINAPMLPGLKRNADGSLTIYIQNDSPGKDKESNWLPAPDGPIFIVMRLYWPKVEPPSILPLGKGSWKPPAIVNVDNIRALDRPRFGDKSLENLIRTDDRYGGDGLSRARAVGATGTISNTRGRSRTRTSGPTRNRPISSASSICPPVRRSPCAATIRMPAISRSHSTGSRTTPSSPPAESRGRTSSRTPARPTPSASAPTVKPKRAASPPESLPPTRPRTRRRPRRTRSTPARAAASCRPCCANICPTRAATAPAGDRPTRQRRGAACRLTKPRSPTGRR